jgi:hypothetical protein
MSWLFSRALVEASLEATSSDGARSALSNGSPTPRAFLPPDRTTAFSRPSRFGMTFGPLTDDLGAELLTWFLAASRARTSALPEREPESTESEAECGPTWRGSLARFDPDSRSWRTAQRSLLGDSGEFSVTWPSSGMTADGQCWELMLSEPTISATDSGLWPTPTAAGFECADIPRLLERREKYAAKYGNNGFGLTLNQAVKVWATPVTRDYRHPGRSRMERTGSKAGDPLPQQVGGALNPTWVEWLMGWPLGWTDLKPSATDRCHSAPLQPGECSPQTSERNLEAADQNVAEAS